MERKIKYSPKAVSELDKIWNYLVFYHLPSDYIVYIDRVLYTRRDYKRILFPDAEKSEADAYNWDEK